MAQLTHNDEKDYQQPHRGLQQHTAVGKVKGGHRLGRTALSTFPMSGFDAPTRSALPVTGPPTP